jgi:uncharacterized protein involved in exopolysaccharide biosynthesis
MSEDIKNRYPQQNGEYDDDEINLVELLETIWDGRRSIVVITGAFAVLAVVIALLLPNKYTASVTILPDTDSRGMGQMAQFAGLASIAGLNVGGTSEIELYPAIIRSENVLSGVIYKEYETERYTQPVDLVRFWDIDEDTREEEYEKALKKLREDVISVSVARDTRLVTLNVETEEPKLSADIANAIADRLDMFMLTQRRTKASEQRQWIEQRLAEIETELAAAEDAVTEFREANRRIMDSPALMLQEGRLLRDVEVLNAMYVELKTQYEGSRIQEIRDMPIVQILDYARIPVEKSGPNRKMIVLIAFVLGGFLSIGTVFVRNFINSSEENQSFFKRISSDVRKDLGISKEKSA